MAGFMPAIHALLSFATREGVDARHKAGHDERLGLVVMAKKAKEHSLATIPGALVLVGAGKMGGAMLDGWLARKLPPKKIIVLDPQPSKSIKALAKRGIRINPKGDVGPVAALVIAVKPQTAPDALPLLAALVDGKTVVVSIMAGRTLGFLEKHLPGAAIVRAMPNTPAAIGRGITVAVGNAKVKPVARKLAHGLLAATGAVEWVNDEALMDAVTAVSGSGPAYVFLLAEAMAAAGRRRGPARHAGRQARPRDRGRLGRTAASLGGRRLDLAPERHLARRHHRGGARCADGGRRRAAADEAGDRRCNQAWQRPGWLELAG